MNSRRRIAELAGREYVPMVATIAMWAVVLAAIGHADAARLLATATMVRAIQLLTKLATSVALKRRQEAPLQIRRQAGRYAFDLQLAALAVALVLIAGLTETMKHIGQHQIAGFLPYVALGMPARYLRFADVRTASPYFRIALSFGGLGTVLLGLVLGWPAALFGLAFGAREWIAYVVLRWWPRSPRPAKVNISDPLHFPEVARYSVVLGRRLLTYRLSKTLLTIFGPVGNVAARTGRGLNWHKRIEPYVPHHLGGFLLFTGVMLGGAILLVSRSGEPAAMIVAAGMLQMGAAAANVVLLWRYMPEREDAVPEDDDEE